MNSSRACVLMLCVYVCAGSRVCVCARERMYSCAWCAGSAASGPACLVAALEPLRRAWVRRGACPRIQRVVDLIRAPLPTCPAQHILRGLGWGTLSTYTWYSEYSPARGSPTRTRRQAHRSPALSASGTGLVGQGQVGQGQVGQGRARRGPFPQTLRTHHAAAHRSASLASQRIAFHRTASHRTAPQLSWVRGTVWGTPWGYYKAGTAGTTLAVSPGANQGGPLAAIGEYSRYSGYSHGAPPSKDSLAHLTL